MQERRRYIRWQIDREARVQLPGEETCVGCQIKDINYKGVKISLTERLEEDTYITLAINLSYDCALNIEAWVAWHKQIQGHNLYGLYFNKIRDSDKEKIYKFMRSNFSEQINKQWWNGITEKKGGSEMDDQRIFERLPAKLPMRFLEPISGKEGQAQTEDISAKGIGLISREELGAKTALEIWIQIPDRGEPLYTRGEVAWSRMIEPNNYRAGIKLEKADLMGMSRVLRAI